MEAAGIHQREKTKQEVFVLSVAGGATRLHLIAGDRPVCLETGESRRVAYALTPESASAILRQVAAKCPGEDVILIMPATLLARFTAAARGAGARRLVLPATSTSVVLCLDRHGAELIAATV